MRTKRQSQQKDAAPWVAPVITVNWFNMDVTGGSGEVEAVVGGGRTDDVLPLHRPSSCDKVSYHGSPSAGRRIKWKGAPQSAEAGQ